MLKRLVRRVAILTAAIGITAWLLPGFNVTGGFFAYVWIAVLFGAVNAVIGPVLRVIAFPITVLTLGLFALVVNAALIGITAKLSSHLAIDGFWIAVLSALLISIFSAIGNRLIRT